MSEGLKRPPEPDGREQQLEQEGHAEVRESAETVAELMTQWAKEYSAKETPSDRKQELAYRIAKLEIALNTSGLHAQDVKVRESAPGVLGFYRTDTGEVAITEEGLGDVSHYEEILVHESAHKGGIHDEGAAQLATRRRVGSARRSIYEGEQRKIEQTFDVSALLEKYDIKDPRELIDPFLDVEWHDRWNAEWRSKVAKKPLADGERQRHKLFDSVLGEQAVRLERSVKRALPDLYDKLERQGFDFGKAQQDRFDELYEEDIAKAA